MQSPHQVHSLLQELKGQMVLAEHGFHGWPIDAWAATPKRIVEAAEQVLLAHQCARIPAPGAAEGLHPAQRLLAHQTLQGGTATGLPGNWAGFE